MLKVCLHCGLQFPESADFCSECGRPIEDAIRVESGGKLKRIKLTNGCFYCGLQLPASAEFCPECGRLIERSFDLPVRSPVLQNTK